MPAAGSFIGIDLGTSSVKAVAINGEGSVLGRASRAYELSLPRPGWRQIDPEIWWTQTCACVRELLEGIAPYEVLAVGVTGQMHTVVAVGQDGRAVHPALMWNDVRTSDAVASARAALAAAGANDAAATVSAGSPALNLCWLRDNDPGAFSAATSFVIGPDWIVHKLTGTIGTDYCEASTSSLFDFASHGWSASAFETLGLPLEIAPAIHGACEAAGCVTDEAARATGIPAGTPVIVGTGDNPAAAIPTGCVTHNATVISLGTSGVLMGLRALDAAQGLKGKRIAFSLDGKGFATLVQGVVQSCCSSRDWLLQNVLHITHQKAEAAFDPAASGTGEVLFFPHMTGEKTLYADASLRGAFTGLSPDTDAAELDRALMEGIAYGLRQLADEMGFTGKTDAIRVVGGGARSDAWLQTIANVLRRPVQRMEGETGAGYGAALLAQMAVQPNSGAGTTVKLGVIFAPDEAAAGRHDRRFEHYLRLHDALVSVYGD